MDFPLSVKGAVWRARLSDGQTNAALDITEKTGCDPLVARVMAARGATPTTARTWLNPKLRDLMSDPSDFADMNAAIDRIARAIETNEQIAIFGDYDVDGACSTALIARYLSLAGARPALFYIPDRMFEGYGLNAGAISHLAHKQASLLISVDCGTTAHAELAHARQIGLDAIVIDHHEPDPALPPGLIVNPKRTDDLSGEQALCAAGVVFLMLVGLNRELRQRGYFASRPEPDLKALAHLVALATIADVAPLTALNRAFVRAGLHILDNAPGAGLAALLALAEAKKPLTPTSIGFQIGPRLNAGGRLGDSSLATLLLLTENPEEARSIAHQLDTLNAERRALEQEAVVSAIKAIETLAHERGLGPAVFATGHDWHPGVAGLIAARLAEAYQRPAFAITFQGDAGVGSARSGGAADIGLIVKEAAALGIIARGGGHAAAAGLALTRAQFEPFCEFVSQRLEEAKDRAAGPPCFLHDGQLAARTPRDLLTMIGELEAAGPYGQANPEPTFVIENASVQHLKILSGAHIKFAIQTPDLPFHVSAIAFRAADTNLGRFLTSSAAERQAIRLLVSAEINEFRGERTPQARIIDAAAAPI